MAPTQNHVTSFAEGSSKTEGGQRYTTTAYININNTNSTDNPTATRCEQKSDQITLPITSTGHFSHDSFFDNFQKQFDASVRNVEDLWDSKSDEDFLCARRLRDLSHENQALTVTEDQEYHRIAINMKNFMDGDVKVKVVDDNELLVEGNAGKQGDGSVTKRSFCRRFVFPGLVREDIVSASMSADGVLTITVPKKENSSSKKIKNVQITTSNETLNDSKSTSTSIKNNQEKRATNVERTSQTSSQDSQSTQKKLLDSRDLLQDSLHFPSPFLPISTRGRFFHDSFFEDSRKQFQSAVDQILQEWGEDDSTTDQMNLYRDLRKHKLQEETQAVSSSENHQCHKIVVDVQDFKEGDVKVEVLSENELRIKGEVEVRQGNSVSKKSFLRRFLFPGLVSADTVSSVMSSDGILTVTVQKAASQSTVGEIKEKLRVPVNTSENSCSQTSIANSQNMESNSESFVSKFERSEKSSSYMGNVLSAESHHSENSYNNVSEEGTTLSQDVSSLGDFPFHEKYLSIAPRGLFFSDSFFENVRKDFETAVSEVLSRHDAMKTIDDDLSCYRSLREKNLNDETQALKTTEDQKEYKVVLDVQGFNKEDIKVKVEDESEVVVEGHVEKGDGTCRSTRSFRRRFNIPSEVNMKAIASAMSSDGVLTITAPKVVKNFEKGM